MRDKFQAVSRVLPPGDVLYLRLGGQNSPGASRERSQSLAHRLHRGGYRGLVIDFKRAVFLHNETQFDHLAGRLAHDLPAGLVSAFVYSEAQKAHTIMMIRSLQASGLLAGAFSNHHDAIGWVRDTLTFREVSAPQMAMSA